MSENISENSFVSLLIGIGMWTDCWSFDFASDLRGRMVLVEGLSLTSMASISLVTLPSMVRVLSRLWTKTVGMIGCITFVRVQG